MEKRPRVSVATGAYNYEHCIAEAVESVMAQEAQFEFEMIVGEDFSTDCTRAVLLELQRKYPGRLALLLPEMNLGAHENYSRILAACTGEYVAFLDGDDYWTDAGKIAKQVALLDAHPDCVACGHDVVQREPDGTRHLITAPGRRRFYGLDDLLVRNFTPTCSLMVRRSVMGGYPDWIRCLKLGDWPLTILAARHGKIGYLREPMAVYRIHSGGVWSQMSAISRVEECLKMLDLLMEHAGDRHRPAIRRALAQWTWELAANYELAGDHAGARKHGWEAVRAAFRAGRVPSARMATLILRVSAPRAGLALRKLRGQAG